MEDPQKSEIEKKRADSQLRQLQGLKNIGLLAGSIIHSFNNAIGVVRGYADLALRKTSSHDGSYAYLQQILEGIDAVKVLVEKMRIFAGQKQMDFQLINIHTAVEEALKTFRESLAVPIDIQRDCDTVCGLVLADAGQIQQAVINLCDNAYEARKGNGVTLKISLNEVGVGGFFAEGCEHLKEGSYVKLTVGDTGQGMSQDILRRIYEPFFTTKTAGRHAGLGLSAVHEIVRIHQGKIIVESHLGEGTTFHIFLPLAGQGHEKKEE